VRTTAALGIDYSGQRAKGLDAFADQHLDRVVTACDDAAEACPYLPGARCQEHWSFPDPNVSGGPEVERLAVFRHVCDAISARIAQFLAQQDVERQR
jgi:arsenate reductase (thioredoxin)